MFAKKIAGKSDKTMEIYLTHDLMLIAILKAIFGEVKESPPLSSTLFFELHYEDSEYFVKVIYNNKTMELPNWVKNPCDFEDFSDLIDDITYSSYEAFHAHCWPYGEGKRQELRPVWVGLGTFIVCYLGWIVIKQSN